MSERKELELKIQDLMARRSELKAEAMVIQARLNELAVAERAAAVFANLSDDDRAALAQTLQAEGVESGEQVGNLGG